MNLAKKPYIKDEEDHWYDKFWKCYHLRTLGVILTNFHRSKQSVLQIVADCVNLL